MACMTAPSGELFDTVYTDNSPTSWWQKGIKYLLVNDLPVLCQLHMMIIKGELQGISDDGPYLLKASIPKFLWRI
jgi:hypothetical protein